MILLYSHHDSTPVPYRFRTDSHHGCPTGAPLVPHRTTTAAPLFCTTVALLCCRTCVLFCPVSSRFHTSSIQVPYRFRTGSAPLVPHWCPTAPPQQLPCSAPLLLPCGCVVLWCCAPLWCATVVSVVHVLLYAHELLPAFAVILLY